MLDAVLELPVLLDPLEFLPFFGYRIPLIFDKIKPLLGKPVVIGGEHSFRKLTPMGLENRLLVAEDVEGEPDPGGDPVRVPDSALALDLAPVLADPDSGIDIEARGDLPGVLDKSLYSCVWAVEVVAFILVGLLWA